VRTTFVGAVLGPAVGCGDDSGFTVDCDVGGEAKMVSAESVASVATLRRGMMSDPRCSSTPTKESCDSPPIVPSTAEARYRLDARKSKNGTTRLAGDENMSEAQLRMFVSHP
jgi:hypothetical protein